MMKVYKLMFAISSIISFLAVMSLENAFGAPTILLALASFGVCYFSGLKIDIFTK